VIRTALQLASCGLHVFPCRPRDKRPATTRGLRDATTDEDAIRRWWRLEPQYNVAIATGTVSGVFVLDVDGIDAESELRRLEKEHGQLPPSVEAITPRPGRHVYFRCPAAPLRNSAGKIAPGIDTRADGGYVIAPPSIHPSGRRYAWSVDTANTVAPAPDWLLDRITQHTNGSAPTPPAEWRALVADGADEGQRDCSVTRLAGHLLRRHVDPCVVLDLLQVWNVARCTPPLPADDISRIVNSITGRELKRRGARE
jgi:hypothetical protein